MEREFVYTEQPTGYAIRNETYKLLKFDSGEEELYNLILDPYESNNLIGPSMSEEAVIEKANLTLEASAIRN